MEHFDEHTKLPGGFRMRPDGRGGLSYVKAGNELLRGVPASDRLLELLCHAAGGPRGPRLVGVVTKDWQVLVVANPATAEQPGRLFTQCRCGPEGHTLVLAKIVKKVELIGHRPAKGRRVDVRDVSDLQ